MLDFQITLSEKHIHEFLSICRRMLVIAELHLPTPSEEVVAASMKPKAIIPGKVGRVDPMWADDAEEAAERFGSRTGQDATAEQLQTEVDEMRKEGLL